MDNTITAVQAENLEANRKIASRQREIFDANQQAISIATTRMFGYLALAQWAGSIVVAMFVSPRTWSGAMSSTHLHLWAAFVLGGLVSLFPAYVAFRHADRSYTPYIMACGQVLMSALLIHLTGGRIETHFHVFGSLAFIAAYRSWRVMLPAIAIVAVDHIVRGSWWPQSVFGVVTASNWRWFEHACWVLFETFFLHLQMRRSLAEMGEMAEKQAQVEETLRPFLEAA